MDSKEMLNSLSIYQLRIKAREMGVKAPTMKKQKQLIDEILKIQSGEMVAIKSKMGRPPKNKFLPDSLNSVIDENLSTSGEYDDIKLGFNFALADPFAYETNQQTFEFMGVVRACKGKKIVFNYLKGKEYVYLDNATSKGFIEGDLVVGTAKPHNETFGLGLESKKLELESSKTSEKQLKIVSLSSIKEMYNFINSSKNVNKIVVEAEALNLNFDRNKDEIFFYTEECADVVKTYNMLLDVKNYILSLSKKSKPFCLYLVDVEYIYSMLNMYYIAKGTASDINAGQYFKEILSAIYSSEAGSVVVFEKDGGMRSSYLDIILNKYCQK